MANNGPSKGLKITVILLALLVVVLLGVLVFQRLSGGVSGSQSEGQSEGIEYNTTLDNIIAGTGGTRPSQYVPSVMVDFPATCVGAVQYAAEFQKNIQVGLATKEGVDYENEYANLLIKENFQEGKTFGNADDSGLLDMAETARLNMHQMPLYDEKPAREVGTENSVFFVPHCEPGKSATVALLTKYHNNGISYNRGTGEPENSSNSPTAVKWATANYQYVLTVDATGQYWRIQDLVNLEIDDNLADVWVNDMSEGLAINPDFKEKVLTGAKIPAHTFVNDGGQWGMP